jgi:hypothetical protein
MKTEKEFHCLQMKEIVQSQLREEWRGLTAEQIREEITRFLATSENSVAVWWRAEGFSKKRSPTKLKFPLMTKPKKEFDCVKMKHDIQAKLERRLQKSS